MTIQTDKIRQTKDYRMNRTLATAYPLHVGEIGPKYTLWDSERLVGLYTAYSYFKFVLSLSVAFLLLSSFIPAYSDGGLKGGTPHSDYAQSIAEHLPNIDFERLATAIYHAEGGSKTRHPYGILSVRCTGEAQCRRVCLNTIKNNYRRWKNAGKPGSYLEFLASRYAPTNSSPLNRFWLNNVRSYVQPLTTPTLVIEEARNGR